MTPAWIAPAAAELGARGPDFQTKLELASVALSLRNLMTFPWIYRRVESGTLALHGAYFAVASGQLLVRDPATGAFAPIADGRLPLRCDAEK